MAVDKVPGYFKRAQTKLIRAKYDCMPVAERMDAILRQMIDVEQRLSQQPVTDIIDLLHQTKRALDLCLSGAGGDFALRDEIDNLQDPTWKFLPEEDLVDEKKADKMAEAMFAARNLQKGDKITIYTTSTGRRIVEKLVELCLQNGVDFDIEFRDYQRDTVLINKLDEPALAIIADLRKQLYEGSKATLRVESAPTSLPKKEKMRIFGKLMGPLMRRIRQREIPLVLTTFPTESDAAHDKVAHAVMVDRYLKAGDQPRPEIKAANAKVIEKLNQAKTIHIVNDEGTDVTFDVEGMTFANSHVVEMAPGSEVFSAPKINGVNGTIFAKGYFHYPGYPVMRDITLVFENGKVIDSDAAEGKETLADILDTAGANFVGEIGFGTNPYWQWHTVNRQLAEIVSGSFHIALGDAYQFTEYDGKPVHADNGNRSPIHFDITTMLRGNNGVIEVDGEVIQRNGEWLIPGCEVLNKGWGALPNERWPEWYKKEAKGIMVA